MVNILGNSAPSFPKRVVWPNTPSHLQVSPRDCFRRCLPHATWTDLLFSHREACVSPVALLFTCTTSSSCCWPQSHHGWSPAGRSPRQDPTLLCEAPASAHVFRVQAQCSDDPEVPSHPCSIAATSLLRPSLGSQYFPDVLEKLGFLVWDFLSIENVPPPIPS